MGDQAWESIYSDEKHINSWPWSEVVSLFHRYKTNLPQQISVMELGPGTGNNYPFFKSINAEYFGIEQSETAVNLIHSKWPELIKNVKIGDFSDISLRSESYDLILDRASVTHATTNEIKSTLESAYQALVPGGLYIGIDWFSTRHESFGKGKIKLDSNTEMDFESGQFSGLGRVHFSDSKHIDELFYRYKFLEKSEKTIVGFVNQEEKETFASWSFVAKKEI